MLILFLFISTLLINMAYDYYIHKVMNYKIVLLIYIFSLASCQDYSFKSFRVAEKASIYLTEATAPLMEACNHIEYLALEDFNMTFGEQLSSETLYIYKLTPTSKVCDASKLTWSRVAGGQDYTEAATNYDLMEFVYSFQWKVKVLEIITLYGTGTLKISTLGVGYRQDIVNGGPKSTMKFAMNANLVDFTCTNSKSDHVAKLKPALSHEISVKFPELFEAMALNKIPPYLDQSAWNIYRKYEMVYNKGMLVDLINTIIHTNFYMTTDNVPYVTLQFNSLVSIPNRPFNISIWRNISTAGMITSANDAEICYNIELLPDVLDILGKGRYFYLTVTEQQISLSLTLRQFASVMPELLNYYSEDTPVVMGCRPDISEMVVDVKKSDRTIQWPFRCVYVMGTTGEEFLSALVEFRMLYTVNSINSNMMTATITGSYVHNIKPASRYNLLSLSMISEVMNRFAQSFNNQPFLDPGYINVQINNMNSYDAKSYGVDGDAYCIRFNKKTSTSKE